MEHQTFMRHTTVEERKVFAVLTTQPAHWNEIASLTGKTNREAMMSLTLLELKGFVRQYPGKRFARV